MISRLGFYDLGENLLKNIKIEIRDIIEKVDSLFTYLNSVETNPNILLKLEMIRKAESKTKEMLQIMISKVNPDLNRLIELDNKENDSHRTLVFCVGLVQNKIEKNKEEIMNKLSNFQRNDITNKISLDNFSSYLHGVINDLIFTPLKEALNKYILIEKMEEPVTDSIKTFEGKIISIKKDSNLYWYLAFSYMYRSSQIIGFMSEAQLKVKPFDITDAKKLISTILRQKPQSQERKEGETPPSSTKKEEKKEGSEEISEEILEEDEELEEDEDLEEIEIPEEDLEEEEK